MIRLLFVYNLKGKTPGGAEPESGARVLRAGLVGPVLGQSCRLIDVNRDSA
jgi:hypothetical protein